MQAENQVCKLGVFSWHKFGVKLLSDDKIRELNHQIGYQKLPLPASPSLMHSSVLTKYRREEGQVAWHSLF